jgi:hypothetical protein
MDLYIHHKNPYDDYCGPPHHTSFEEARACTDTDDIYSEGRRTGQTRKCEHVVIINAEALSYLLERAAEQSGQTPHEVWSALQMECRG